MNRAARRFYDVWITISVVAIATLSVSCSKATDLSSANTRRGDGTPGGARSVWMGATFTGNGYLPPKAEEARPLE